MDFCEANSRTDETNPTELRSLLENHFSGDEYQNLQFYSKGVNVNINEPLSNIPVGSGINVINDMTASPARDLIQLSGSSNELPHKTFIDDATMQKNASSSSVPSTKYTDDAINAMHNSQEVNVTLGEGNNTKISDCSCDHPDNRKKDLDVDVHVRWLQQQQREILNDPDDWRILERYLLAEATLKGFVKTHYGYGPAVVEDLNIFSLPTPERPCVRILYERILPVIMILAFVYVACKFPETAIMAIVFLLLFCLLLHKCKCRCRCCCCCSCCQIPKWFYRFVKGSRSKRWSAALILTALIALPTMLIFFFLYSFNS